MIVRRLSQNEIAAEHRGNGGYFSFDPATVF